MKNFYEINEIYQKIKIDIDKRLDEFKLIGKKGNEKELFIELAFCILTPQSKAKNAFSAIEKMVKNNVLFLGNADDLVKYLNVVRFKNNKAKYLIEARKKILEDKDIKLKQFLKNEDKNILEKRKFLVDNIKGFGYKEASHFLRNVGFGENIAILDRHILRNLIHYGIIDEFKLTPKIYIEIEKKMRKFSQNIDIPLDALDIVFWYKETGGIFK